MKIYTCLFIFIVCTSTVSFAQDSSSVNVDYDRVSIGLGFGFDYGGLGGNFTVYPQKNIGLFAGAGYAFAGLGYNVGVKLRLTPKRLFTPFFTAMYGYNAAIVVSNSSNLSFDNLSKLFYGPSVGIGFDLGSIKKGYLSVAILVPFRSADVDNYINQLKTNDGVQFKNNLLPVAFSIGYRFVLKQ